VCVCLIVCDTETSTTRPPRPELGSCATGKENVLTYVVEIVSVNDIGIFVCSRCAQYVTCSRGEFRPRQTRQLPRAVDLKGRLLSCQSY